MMALITSGLWLIKVKMVLRNHKSNISNLFEAFDTDGKVRPCTQPAAPPTAPSPPPLLTAPAHKGSITAAEFGMGLRQLQVRPCVHRRTRSLPLLLPRTHTTNGPHHLGVAACVCFIF